MSVFIKGLSSQTPLSVYTTLQPMLFAFVCSQTVNVPDVEADGRFGKGPVSEFYSKHIGLFFVVSSCTQTYTHASSCTLSDTQTNKRIQIYGEKERRMKCSRPRKSLCYCGFDIDNKRFLMIAFCA